MVFEHLPKDHPLSRVYRVGGALVGLVVLAFGIVGLFNRTPGFFDTDGHTAAGLSFNTGLAVLSIVAGLVLLAGAVIGGNVASNVNIAVGAVFIVSGLVNLCVIRTDLNYLAFRMSNIIFTFLVGLVLFAFGMYGRVSGSLPFENPNWQRRHADDEYPTSPTGRQEVRSDR
ncbi:MAG: DUF4383 domain-containing protein [Mycobacteriales bacterium]|jgi:hypothetical protein